MSFDTFMAVPSVVSGFFTATAPVLMAAALLDTGCEVL
jgi:hypothetical protein